MFTIGNWIVFAAIFVIGIIVSIQFFAEGTTVHGITGILGTLILVGIVMFCFGWYNTNTAAGTRALRDFKSNIENGYEREITITAEDGREIYHYEGKIDIETDPTKNYILFDDANGKRHIIYYGVQDTILIVDK